MPKPEDNPLFRELKRTQAERVDIVLADGSRKSMGIPKVRNRWDRLGKALEVLEWVAVEGYRGDNLTCALKAEEVVGDDDEDDGGDEDVYEDGADVARVASVMSKSQRETMKECREIFKVVTDGAAKMFDTNAKMLDAFAMACASIGDAYKLSAQIRGAEAIADAGKSGASEDVINMVKTAMGFIALQSANKPPPPPPPPPQRRIPIPARSVERKPEAPKPTPKPEVST